MKNGFLKLAGILLVCLLIATMSPLTAAGEKEVVATDTTKVDLGKSLVLYSSMTENDLTNLLKGFALM